MRFLIISDMFSLDSWLIDGEEPEIMPAGYEFFKYLGSHKEHSFDAVIMHPTTSKVVRFPNNSVINIFQLNAPLHYARKYLSLSYLREKAETILNSEKQYDIIYGTTIYANVARELGIKYNLPSVARLFGSLIWDAIQKKQWIKVYTRFRYQLLEVQKPCDLVICTEDGTEFDKAITKYSPSANFHLLYNGINDGLRKTLLEIPVVSRINKKETIRFCYIARFTNWKRQDLALKIIFKLKNKYGLKTKLDLYGKGENEDKLIRLIKKLQIQNEVNIVGSVPHKEIPKVLSKYHVSFFLYDASNLGNAMWESAIAGRLIFTRNTGKTSHVLNTNNSVIMNRENIEEACRNFINLLDKDIDQPTIARKEINDMLPNWKSRLDNEMNLIKDFIQRK